MSVQTCGHLHEVALNCNPLVHYVSPRSQSSADLSLYQPPEAKRETGTSIGVMWYRHLPHMLGYGIAVEQHFTTCTISGHSQPLCPPNQGGMAGEYG